jgi:hypothetical protein
MLFDIGGYYNGLIRKWLAAIGWRLAHGPSASGDPYAGRASHGQRQGKAARILIVALIIVVGGALVLFFFVLPLIGIITGDLYLSGRNGRDLTLHGIWARVVSAALLAIGLFIAFRIWKPKPSSRPRILFPPERRH